MMKKCSKKTCAAAATGATGAGATSIVEESLPHNCKGNCCRNEQENRKKVVCVLLLLFLLFPTNSSIHSSQLAYLLFNTFGLYQFSYGRPSERVLTCLNSKWRRRRRRWQSQRGCWGARRRLQQVWKNMLEIQASAKKDDQVGLLAKSQLSSSSQLK